MATYMNEYIMFLEELYEDENFDNESDHEPDDTTSHRNSKLFFHNSLFH